MMTPFDPLFDAALHARKPRHRPAPTPPHLAPRATSLGYRLMVLVMVPPLLVALMLIARPAHARTRIEPGFEAALPDPPAPKPADGGILNLTSGYAALVEGARAHGVGDSLVIVLSEQFTSSKSAASKTGKTASFSFTPPNKGPLSLLSGNQLNNSGASTFNGSGNASQTSSLGGEISVTIAEVRRNGTVLVRGNKRLLLSQGQEWVQFSGIVRLADIDTTNRVQSGQVADARITYSGNGSISRASREGWLTKLLSFFSPF